MTFCCAFFKIPTMHSATPFPWVLHIDVHFHWILNRCAKSCTALQSNFRSLSLKVYCGRLNSMITSFLTNSITPSELNKSAGIAQAAGHFEICSTATIRYWFHKFVQASGPANSMHHVWNNSLTRILPANSLRLAGFGLRHISQLSTKLGTSWSIPSHQKRSLINEYVELKSQCPTSSCSPSYMLSRISM